eukprot:195436-Rhodomonas_salina.1
MLRRGGEQAQDELAERAGLLSFAQGRVIELETKVPAPHARARAAEPRTCTRSFRLLRPKDPRVRGAEAACRRDAV